MTPSRGSESSRTLFRLRTFFFLLMFLALFGLFLVLSYHVPVREYVGWLAVVVFLFFYFLGEPLYRRLTDQWEHHVLVLEFYVITIALIQLAYPADPYLQWLYVLPIFSAALSFGLPGTTLVALVIFLIETVRSEVFDFWEGAVDMGQFETLLPDVIPLIMLALLLGFTVELKEYIQRQLIRILTRRDVVEDLRNLVRQTRFDDLDLDGLLRVILNASDVRGALLWDEREESVLQSVRLPSPEREDLVRRLKSDNPLPGNAFLTDFPLPTERVQVAFSGLPGRGILRQARQKLIQSLLDYLEQTMAAEQAVRERNLVLQKTELLYDMVPVGILECRADGRIENINRKARTLIDGSGAEDLRFRDLFFNGDQPLPLEEQRREARLNGAGGIPIDLSVVTIPREGEQEWLAVFTDQRPFQQARKKAERERRLRAVGEVGASLAHEIRNPLGSLAGYLSLLERRIEQREDEELNEPVSRLRKSYRALDGLVQQFVDFAQSPAVEDELFRLQSVVEETLDLVTIPDGVETVVETPDQDVVLTGISERLRVALANLLRNSLDAISGSGTVTIRLEERDEFAVVTVEDTGSGMEESVVDEMFEPFYTTREEGLGLGMSIVHRIVREEFDGQIEVGSEPDRGTRIQLFLPTDSE